MTQFEDLKVEVAEDIGLFVKDPTVSTSKFTELERIEDISELPSNERSEIPTTHMKSGDVNTYIGGKAEPGTVGFKIQRVTSATGQKLVRKLETIKVPFPWLVVYPDGTTTEFSAFIKSYKSNVPLGEVRVDEIILKRSGAKIEGVKGSYDGV